MARLVFNADDLGLSHGINRGILECYKKGVVNSASLMTNTPFFEEAVGFIHEHQLPNIGLHFNLTEFQPLLATHKTLCNADGTFIRAITNQKQVDVREVADELEAQYSKAVRAGVCITHFDSHHHVHMSALLRKEFVTIAAKYRMPLRKCHNTYRNPLKRLRHYWLYRKQPFYTELFSSLFYDEAATVANLNHLIKNTTATLEIMCHPGYEDQGNGAYNSQRLAELKLLTDAALVALVQKKNNLQ